MSDRNRKNMESDKQSTQLSNINHITRNGRYENKRADPEYVERNSHNIWNPPSQALRTTYQNQNRQVNDDFQQFQQYPALPHQPQKMLYTPSNNWTMQQQNQNIRNEQLLQPQQPQVTLLQRNRNNVVTPGQVSQQMAQPEVGIGISRLGESWSVGPNA